MRPGAIIEQLHVVLVHIHDELSATHVTYRLAADHRIWIERDKNGASRPPRHDEGAERPAEERAASIGPYARTGWPVVRPPSPQDLDGQSDPNQRGHDAVQARISDVMS
jgi:hypothetical protein